MERHELMEALRGVPGWLRDDEAWALHEAVRTQAAGHTAITVVEIGSWQGRSTIAIAAGLRARGSGTVHAVDPHRNTPLHRAMGIEDTSAAFLVSVEGAGLAGYVRALRERSSEARPRFADRSVDLLFLDGSHLYEDVLSDIDAWTPALTDGAAVAFHDAGAEPGVGRALAERVEPEDSPFRALRSVDDLVLAEYRPQAAVSATVSATPARST